MILIFLIGWIFRNNDKQIAGMSPAFSRVPEAGCGYGDARSIQDFQRDGAQVFPPNQERGWVVERGCCALLLGAERYRAWSTSFDLTRSHFCLCSFDFIARKVL